MDDDFRIDLDEIARIIEGAEIVTMFFPVVRKSLVLDLRYDDQDDPWVRVMPMVSGPQERVDIIRKMRPTFPRPERIAFVPWPKYASTLVRMGVYDMLKKKLESIGRPAAVEDLRRAAETLQGLERKELAAVISGKGYRTLWQARE